MIFRLYQHKRQQYHQRADDMHEEIIPAKSQLRIVPADQAYRKKHYEHNTGCTDIIKLGCPSRAGKTLLADTFCSVWYDHACSDLSEKIHVYGKVAEKLDRRNSVPCIDEQSKYDPSKREHYRDSGCQQSNAAPYPVKSDDIPSGLSYAPGSVLLFHHFFLEYSQILIFCKTKRTAIH